MAMKVIQRRKNAMQQFKPDADGAQGKLRYKEKERDITLYKISIDMLRGLPKEETPRAKRRLINESF